MGVERGGGESVVEVVFFFKSGESLSFFFFEISSEFFVFSSSSSPSYTKYRHRHCDSSTGARRARGRCGPVDNAASER